MWLSSDSVDDPPSTKTSDPWIASQVPGGLSSSCAKPIVPSLKNGVPDIQIVQPKPYENGGWQWNHLSLWEKNLIICFDGYLGIRPSFFSGSFVAKWCPFLWDKYGKAQLTQWPKWPWSLELSHWRKPLPNWDSVIRCNEKSDWFQMQWIIEHVCVCVWVCAHMYTVSEQYRSCLTMRSIQLPRMTNNTRHICSKNFFTSIKTNQHEVWPLRYFQLVLVMVTLSPLLYDFRNPPRIAAASRLRLLGDSGADLAVAVEDHRQHLKGVHVAQIRMPPALRMEAIWEDHMSWCAGKIKRKSWGVAGDTIYLYGGWTIVMGVPPMAGLQWKIPSRNGWWLGVPIFQETTICFSCFA